MKPLTFVAVDPAALEHNLRQVRDRLGSDTRLMAVVKADGYGHGLLPAARACAQAGADWLGVSLVEEGVALREAGVELPLLVFLPFTREQAPALVEHRLSGTVVEAGQLVALSSAAQAQGREGHCHLFLDGGLGRPGAGDDLPELVEAAGTLPGLAPDGIYTHLDAGTPPPSILEVLRPGSEWRLWAGTLRQIAQPQWRRPFLLHAAASALTLTQPPARLDLVRVGTLLYGQYPAAVPASAQGLALRPALELRSTVVGVSLLPPGATVGYGGEHRCRRETRVGLLPIGYAHGLGTLPASLARRRGGLRGLARRLLRGAPGGQARIAGRPAPLLGRPAMDWCCVDLSAHPEATVGTEVTLPCRRLMLDSGLPRVQTPLTDPPAEG